MEQVIEHRVFDLTEDKTSELRPDRENRPAGTGAEYPADAAHERGLPEKQPASVKYHRQSQWLEFMSASKGAHKTVSRPWRLTS
ncbi:hypothetical protein [Paraburkholderia xenovorans]